MQFRIADTFTDSLAKLTGDEQKAVKMTAFDLQLNPASPGLSFHKLDRARDKNFWSVRVNRDIRLIVHKTDASLLLCYVDHHDAAYHWAERRKLETHPATGAAQLVEIRETVKEITIPSYVVAEQPAPTRPPLFADVPEEQLLSYGVPPEWLDDVRLATEDSLFELVEHLPREAGEALLELATGGTPEVPVAVPAGGTPFEHPDAQRRFRLVTDSEELRQALDYPWEKWAIFLHPTQRDLVERHYNGPARVAGSAGTGKTVVALHRAAFLARTHQDARILVTTFNRMLARMLEAKLRLLLGNQPRLYERIEVYSIGDVCRRLYTSRLGTPKIADEGLVRQLLLEAASQTEGHRFTERFLWSEWNDVVDAWQLATWEEYRDVARLGRKTRLGEAQRKILWSIFERVRGKLNEQGLITQPTLVARVAENLRQSESLPFDYCIIDEAQDLGVPELRMLAALGGSNPNGLFFAGDLGQRIFQAPFSWKSLGVDVRGRSRTLKINYRTSHQIRAQADRLLPPELSDVDGNAEQRRGTISAFQGPEPTIATFESAESEQQAVADWIRACVDDGIRPEEIGVCVRSLDELGRARRAIEQAEVSAVDLEKVEEPVAGAVSVLTMHQAKGLEFRAVAVMACDDDVLPLQERMENVADDSDLEEVFNTERHLLYVACTRARDRLMVSGVEPASEFLEDLLQNH
ncbi:MAG: DNA helicase [Planctomycetota bacterium]|nr:MAG: DNA helicase [Planctomycetota bacterium]